MSDSKPVLSVVIVTYNSSDVILDCLESLLASEAVRLNILVVDNASTDDTLRVIQDWASGRVPFVASPGLPIELVASVKPLGIGLNDPESVQNGHTLSVISNVSNAGFASGVNVGLRHFLADVHVRAVWILNPDSIVTRSTAAAFAAKIVDAGPFSLMGGRILYVHEPNTIQTDGGKINWRTGVTDNVSLFCPHPQTGPIDPRTLDFIAGACMVASRTFIESAGLVPERYFLYYEEVEWALRRGDLPLLYCDEAVLYHQAGSSIGSATLGRGASAFSLYFKYRARAMFIRKFRRSALTTTRAYATAKAMQFVSKRRWAEAEAVMRGAFELPPPSSVSSRLSPEARRFAFKTTSTE